MDSEDDKVGNLRIKDLRNADFEDREIPGSKLRRGNGGDSPFSSLVAPTDLLFFFLGFQSKENSPGGGITTRKNLPGKERERRKRKQQE